MLVALSYRGPDAPGGVSAALSRAFDLATEDWQWWYLNGPTLNGRSNSTDTNIQRFISQNILVGHYRYCNEFLWPVMHDLPELAIYREEDRASYQKFNLTLAANLLTNDDFSEKADRAFINDYQMALVPTLLTSAELSHQSLFWHIPWPSTVDRWHREPIKEIAQSLLSVQRLGFHTPEYAHNFLDFVAHHIAGARVSFSDLVIETDSGITQVVVAPLGLDYHFWASSARRESPIAAPSTPFILSVDRADVTKGVLERLEGIKCFFDRHPEYIGKTTFMQVLTRTRAGLHIYDDYWNRCNALSSQINEQFARDGWQPLQHIEPVKAEDLASLYNSAAGLLVTPIRDGLNLTAKEFVASRCTNDGALILSPGAGVWHELGQHAFAVNPNSPQDVARAVRAALDCPSHELRYRMTQLKTAVRSNNLRAWWQQITFVNEAKVLQAS